MAALIAILSLLTVLPLAAGTHVHHSTWSNDGTEFRIVRNSHGENYASWKRNGVRYVTTDAGVLAQIEKAMEAHRAISREHSRIGRRHSEIGREHSRIGREHSRIGREASRGGDERELERRQRALEKEQEKLEAKQRELEEEQRKLEAKQRDVERDTERALESIFQRAVREGKAKRD